MQSGTRSCSNQTRSFCFFDAWWFSPLGGATVENGAGLLCPLCFSRLSTTARRIWFSSDTGSESPGSMWASSLRQKKGVPPVFCSCSRHRASVTARVSALWGAGPWAMALWPSESLP